jgi:16S rRNA G966 N2-methylase RsmD
LVFLDPPYRFLRERPDDLRRLAARLSGVIVFRHDAQDELSLAPLACFDRRDYGSMTIELLRRS